MNEPHLSIPVQYKGETWYCQECLRDNLLKYLKEINPEYKILIYNKRLNTYITVKLREVRI
jgi:hypothetical protein